jgi:hypothetical protein
MFVLADSNLEDECRKDGPLFTASPNLHSVLRSDATMVLASSRAY